MSFKSSIRLTLLLFVLALIFARLGLWQLERKTDKEALFERFENAPALGIETALLRQERFARVEAHGYYDTQRHLLLDNKMHEGRAGVHVLTPFTLADGTSILVNRGWLPLTPDRLTLPEVPTDAGHLTIDGLLNTLPTEGLRVGKPDVLASDRWPQLITYFDPDSINEALGLEMPPWLLQLDAGDASGFDGRQWQPAVMTPAVHRAYALQWFALSATVVVIWIMLGMRQARFKGK